MPKTNKRQHCPRRIFWKASRWSLTLEVKDQKMKNLCNSPLKLYMKFGEDFSHGFQVISIVTTNLIRNDSHRDAPLLKMYTLLIESTTIHCKTEYNFLNLRPGFDLSDSVLSTRCAGGFFVTLILQFCIIVMHYKRF